MIVLVGESASGKSSIEKNLVEHYGYNKIVSYTTRQPRHGEVDGVDYHFIDEDQFNELKNRGFFAESAQYRGWHYGTAKEDCTDDKVAVLTPHGLRQISKLQGINVVSFYINVPRRDRLIKILQRGDDIDEAMRRNTSDVGMFDGISDEVDFVINNVGYEKSVETMTKEILSLCILNNRIIYKKNKKS
jgi:guanylate kinase